MIPTTITAPGTASDFLTRPQAAAFLGLSVTTLNTWACTGRYNLPFYRVGSNVRYKLADLLEWLEARKTNADVEAGA